MYTESINYVAIIIVNALAFVMMSILLLTNRWRLKNDKKLRRLLWIMYIVLVSCVFDTIGQVLNGMDGRGIRWVLYFMDSWQFEANLCITFAWVLFLSDYLHIALQKFHIYLLYGIAIGGIVLLVVNLFTPLIFSFDAGNNYHRNRLYWLFFVVDGLLLLDGIAIYIYKKTHNRGIRIKSFSVWVYMIPVAIGMAINSFMPLITVTWAFLTVGVAGALFSMQNAQIYQDKLTGLFNHFYLDKLKKDLSQRKNSKATVMMLDLNGFKHINDLYGHSVGDQALVHTSEMLVNAVKQEGIVIRYAGDEFVIFLDTQDDEKIEKIKQDIAREFYEFNHSKREKYHLSISVGSCKLDLKTKTIDELLSEVDQKMYIEKELYHKKQKAR